MCRGFWERETIVVNDDIDYAAGLSRAIALMIVNDKIPARGRIVTKGDLRLVIHQLHEAIRQSTDGTIELTMDAIHVRLFVEFLHDFDPDMPPRPICKILGPLVGDHMMNEKLNRLDGIADKLGPMVMLLSGMVSQMERR